MIPAALVLALLVEGLVEYVLGIWWKPMSEQHRKLYMPVIALVLGVALAFGFNIDLLALMGLEQPILGKLLTGVIVGRGSDYLHGFIRDFIKRA